MGLMAEVREVQLSLMRMLLEVCGRHGIDVWVDSGTLLGAVREKGFIPWDDDIDMIMLREGYDRLVALAKEFEPPFFFQCARTDRLYYHGHAQLRMDGTAAILPGDAEARVPFHQGIFIDIFVLDGVPDTREERLAAVAETERWAKRLKVFYEYRPPRQVGPFLRRQIARLRSFAKCFDGYEWSFKKYSVAGCPRVYNWAVNLGKMEERGAIMRRWFEGTVMLEFEGMAVPAPKGYHEYLTAIYGDYMTPCKQPTAHGHVCFDTRRSYKEVLAEWRKGKIEL